MPTSASQRTLLYFLGTGISWGLGFLFIRIAVAEISPATFVFARTFTATLVLSGAMRLTRRAWPAGFDAWRRISILATFGMVVPFLLFAWAGQRMPGGLSSIYNASVPVATVLLSVVVMRQERIGLQKLSGIALGALGILIVLEPWNLSRSAYDGPGQIACIVAVLFLGFAFAYTRKRITPLKLDPIGIAAAQTLVSSIVVAALLPFIGIGSLEMSVPAMLSVIAAGVISTGVAYIWNFRVIEHWGAASASMVTYVVTVVGVGSGFLVLGESLSVTQIAGAIVVFLGVALGTVLSGKPKT